MHVDSSGQAEEELEWACPCVADVELDLAECEEAAVGAAASVAESQRATEEELRPLLKGRAAASGIDADIFLATEAALRGVAAELHGAQVQAETLQHDAAALVAALRVGALRPPPRPPLQARPPAGPGQGGAPAPPPAPAGGRQTRPSTDQIFGPRTRPPAELPAVLDAPAPAGAVGGLPEYNRLLSGLPRELLVRRQLRLSMADVHRYQDEKDIGRDQIVINGEAISGARGGYAAAVCALQTALVVSGGAWQGQSAADAERAAQLLLSVLNRTSSGFAAFEEVLRLFDCPDCVIVSPESAQARPLEATVLEGVVLGRAHTRYAVRRCDGDGEALEVVDAVFVFRVGAGLVRRLAAEGARQAVEQVPAAILLTRLVSASL